MDDLCVGSPANSVGTTNAQGTGYANNSKIIGCLQGHILFRSIHTGSGPNRGIHLFANHIHIQRTRCTGFAGIGTTGSNGHRSEAAISCSGYSTAVHLGVIPHIGIHRVFHNIHTGGSTNTGTLTAGLLAQGVCQITIQCCAGRIRCLTASRFGSDTAT